MLKTKRILCMLLAAMMVCSFTACRKNKTSNGNNSEGYSDDTSNYNSDFSSDVVSTDGEIIGGDPNASGITSANGTTSNKKGTTSNKKGTTSSNKTPELNEIGKNIDTTIDTNQEKMFAAKLKGTTVTIASNSSNPTEDEVNIFEACKQKYGLTVKIEPLTWEDMQANIASLVAGKKAPDLCGFSEVLGLRYAYGNLAQPIDRYLDKSDPVWTTNDALTRFTYAGKCYGAADYDYDTFLIYYNKSLFNEQKNVEDPYTLYKNGQWTFAKFREIAKKMTLMEADGTTVKTFGVCTWNYPVFMLAGGSQGVTYDIKNKWSVNINDAASMEGMQIMHDLAADGSFLMADGYAEFRQRKVAMTIERPMNAIGNYDYYNRMDDEIGMVPMPVGSSGRYYAPVVSNARFVTASAKNPLGAVAYMYEKRIYDMAKAKSTDPTIVKARRKVISDEHLAIYNDYMSKAMVVSSTMDGLANWWDGALNRNQVWNKIIVDKTQPSQAVDSIKGLMLDSLKRTVGASNVAN